MKLSQHETASRSSKRDIALMERDDAVTELASVKQKLEVRNLF